jgi:hypothetical protein
VYFLPYAEFLLAHLALYMQRVTSHLF